MTKEEIIRNFDEHLTKSLKRYYKDFYVGITENVEDRLFGYHKVSKSSDWWIYRIADTEDIARTVESYYLDKGMDGDKGGGKGNGKTKIVYCYEINDHTKERDE